MKFRKKPVVVEATQWWPGVDVDGVVFPDPNPCDVPYLGSLEAKPAVVTLEGLMYVSPGDWIITGVRGEKYPCKPDIFQETYEAEIVRPKSD